MERIRQRFADLSIMADQIAATETTSAVAHESPVQIFGEPTSYYTENVPTVNPKLLIQWRTSVLAFFERVFGPTSATYKEFASHLAGNTHTNTVILFHYLHAVFLSAKTDFDGGYLFDVRNLIHAEVFSDELEQASHFLQQNYKTPAAVISGVVLETTLRKLCDQNSVDLKTDKGRDKSADTMIGDLAKLGVFNKMRADQLRAYMKTRNSAAHGHPDQFNDTDVDLMIQGVRDFVANHLN